MAINLNAAHLQAAQLSVYANQLKTATNQLNHYKSSIATHWQGQEIPYITRAIDQTIAQIDSVLKQLNSLSTDIRNTAAAIQREEEAAAAAARARAFKQQQIQTAQSVYNKAVSECDDLYKEKDVFLRMLKNMQESNRDAYVKKLDALNRKIQEAEKRRSDSYNALAAARR